MNDIILVARAILGEEYLFTLISVKINDIEELLK